MTFGAIQFGGLASGLDTAAIIDAILRVERRPIDLLESRKESEQQKLTLLGTFEGLVKALRDKAQDLRQAGNFFAHSLAVGEEGIAEFTLDGNAQSGTHTLEVLALAQADRYAYAGVASPDTALGTGTISFTYAGTAYTVDVAAGEDTLNGIAAAINAPPPAGSTDPVASEAVIATVVNVGTEAAPSYQLVIAGRETGSDFAIQGLTTSIAGLTGQTQLTAASNAQIEIDNLAVQRSGNLFADVLPGISFTVSATTTTPLTFTVAEDIEGIRSNIQGFVDAYNDVVEFINEQNVYTEEGGASGELFGDRVLESVRSALRRALFEVDAAMAQDYSSLGLVGIELQDDGTLSIDEATLDEKLKGDLDAFSDLFRAEQGGFFTNLTGELDGLLEHSTSPTGVILDGLFDARREAVNRQIEDFDDEVERLEDRLDLLEQSLVKRFAALEDLMAGLNAQSAFLAGGAFPQVNR